MTAKVTVVGSLNIDLVIQTPRIPVPGETILGGDLLTIPGGKGANQAVAAARIGSDVAMVGRVGDDLFATQLKQNLDTEGVDLTYVADTPDTATGVALIVVDEDGQNSIVVASGANARVTVNDIEAAAEVIASADVLLLQLEIPLESLHRAAQIAHENGVQVILNPAPAQTLQPDLLSLIDILIPNETETALITGMPTHSNVEIEAAATNLRASGVGTVILTLGDRGALLVQEDIVHYYEAFPIEQVVDTTAAGDAFVGSLATTIAEGKSLAEAVPWGNAAGALAVTCEGAQPSLPNRQEVETLLNNGTASQLQGVKL